MPLRRARLSRLGSGNEPRLRCALAAIVASSTREGPRRTAHRELPGLPTIPPRQRFGCGRSRAARPTPTSRLPDSRRGFAPQHGGGPARPSLEQVLEVVMALEAVAPAERPLLLRIRAAIDRLLDEPSTGPEGRAH